MSSLSGTIKINLENENATIRFAEDIAIILKPGDCLALSGELGAGKTTFARALIRSVAGSDTIDVPSPTFTLVQEYEFRLSIGHFDLYRLSDASELDELGLNDILDRGVAIIEWPERAEDELPKNCIMIRIEGSGSERQFLINTPDEFQLRLKRSQIIRAFLDDHNYGDAQRSYMLGDASTRAYERISMDDHNSLILMNAPEQEKGPIVEDGKTYSELACLAEDIGPFIAIAKHLQNMHLNAPDIYEYSLSDGLALIENLGSEKPINDHNVPIPERYMLAMELLAMFHQEEPSEILETDDNIRHKVPIYDRDIMQREVSLLPLWYFPFVREKSLPETQMKAFQLAWDEIFTHLDDAEPALVLRDYHSPNIIWCPENEGLKKIGVIDFQDALIGPSAYDVASLAQDARVTVSPELENMLLDHYKSKRLAQNPDFDSDEFDKVYHIMAAQRACKVIGIFVRLKIRDGKSGYLQHIPRIEAYIERLINNPVLAPLNLWFKEVGLFQKRITAG